MMMSFIDAHREDLGIEPICRELAIAPSSYHEHARRLADPGRRPARARRDDEIKAQIKRVHEASSGLYGARKVWHQLLRDGVAVARCTVERLMAAMGLAGVRRGKTTITTVSNPKAPCPLDKVNREFRVERPNALWVVDFTYVHTWAGFVYVAFVIDAYARRIVGWKVSTSATAGFVLDALEQAIHARRPGPEDGLIHHSDRGVQYLAMNYTQRLAEASLVPSVGSVGDSYDNALAETINGLYKTEVIWRQRSWPSASAVEMATLRWVDWYNNHRLFGPIGYIPRRGRGKLLCSQRDPRYGCVTQLKMPPGKPGRFNDIDPPCTVPATSRPNWLSMTSRHGSAWTHGFSPRWQTCR
jgi:transposase InsO family protein